MKNAYFIGNVYFVIWDCRYWNAMQFGVSNIYEHLTSLSILKGEIPVRNVFFILKCNLYNTTKKEMSSLFLLALHSDSQARVLRLIKYEEKGK